MLPLFLPPLVITLLLALLSLAFLYVACLLWSDWRKRQRQNKERQLLLQQQTRAATKNPLYPDDPEQLLGPYQVPYSSAYPQNIFNFQLFSAHTNIPFQRSKTVPQTFEGQDPRWQTQMREIGKTLHYQGVRQIYLVHGTFVGDDPLEILDTIKSVLPKVYSPFEKSVRGFIKARYDFFLNDLGNFTPSYAQILSDGLLVVPARLFIWSSGNHHVARLKGAIKLIEDLYLHVQENQHLYGINQSSHNSNNSSSKNNSDNDRILLAGHSHAGQIFALMGHFLGNTLLYRQLLPFIAQLGTNLLEFQQQVAYLRDINFDVTTFGTPFRYPWHDYPRMRVLHIINHTNSSHLASPLSWLMKNNRGDFIQQLAIAGSDVFAPSLRDRKINEQLDQLLGPGRDLMKWLQNVKLRMRVPPYGKVYLVNYSDDSSKFVGPLGSIFGHGVYTKFDYMLYNLQLIQEGHYSPV